jgi:hypothetical protein
MNRKQLLAELEKEYANIYEFTNGHGDDPLNILDDFLDDAGLYYEGTDLIYAMADGEEPKRLSDDKLSQLLQVFKEVVQECKVELQD